MRVLYLITAGFSFFQIITIFMNGGYSSRAIFFNGGILSSGLFGMLVYEVIFYALIVDFLGGVKISNLKLVFISVLLSASSFSRVPIVLGFTAILIKNGVGFRAAAYTFLFILAMALVLWVRDPGIFTRTSDLTTFFISYPLIGIGRFLQPESMPDLNFYQYASLLFRSFDMVVFPVDYLTGIPLSGPRVYSKQLNEFIFIDFLSGNYNAFGTFLYKYKEFIWWTPALALLDIVQIYILSLLAFGKKCSAKKVVLWFVVNGILFSFNQPFFAYSILVVWIFKSKLNLSNWRYIW